MSVNEGYQAVSRAVFGIGPDQYFSKGTCARCKQELKFSPANGNCQPECYFHFGRKGSISSIGITPIIFGGLISNYLSWDADLCDSCLCQLFHFIFGKDYWEKQSTEVQ